MLESEIIKAMQLNNIEFRPKDFITYLNNGKWQIKFTSSNVYCCELHLKSKGVRRFVTLNAVGNCLRAIGINEFKVIL